MLNWLRRLIARLLHDPMLPTGDMFIQVGKRGNPQGILTMAITDKDFRPLLKTIYCSHCGSTAYDDDKCPDCGADLTIGDSEENGNISG